MCGRPSGLVCCKSRSSNPQGYWAITGGRPTWPPRVLRQAFLRELVTTETPRGTRPLTRIQTQIAKHELPNNIQQIHTETLPKHPSCRARLYSLFPPRTTATTCNCCDTPHGIQVANTSCHEIGGSPVVRVRDKGLLTRTDKSNATPRECSN